MIFLRFELPNGNVEFQSPDGSVRLDGIHPPSPDCYAHGCVIHSPSPGATANRATPPWPYNWREDRSIMERLCPHGVGHPDPDAADYQRRTGREYENSHGCHLDPETGKPCCA